MGCASELIPLNGDLLGSSVWVGILELCGLSDRILDRDSADVGMCISCQVRMFSVSIIK